MSERFKSAMLFAILNAIVGFIFLMIASIWINWSLGFCVFFAVGLGGGGFATGYFLNRK
jgi:hypothetical protein